MPNRKGQRNRKRTPKPDSKTRFTPSSRHSEVDRQELKAERASSIPSREVSVKSSEASSDGDAQGPKHSEPESEGAREVVGGPLQNHDRFRETLVMIHEATCQGNSGCQQTLQT